MTTRGDNEAPNASLRDLIQGLSLEAREQLFEGLDARQLEAARCDWRGTWARPEQLPPDGGDWTVFLYLAGRGAGKTRAAAEWIREKALANPGCRISVVGRASSDVRDVCVEGESGLLAVHAAAERPDYSPANRRISWRNGSIATTFSAEEPDLLRGPQAHFAWCDELASWSRLDETWSNLRLGLRLGAHPRAFVSTTPRPLRLIRELLEAPTTIVRRGSTFDNRANLAPSALAEFERLYGGTRLGRQELEGEVLWDVPGALWNREMLDATRVKAAPADLLRIVVGVDPAVTAKEGSDLTGIVAVGADRQGHLYVLRDVSIRGSPAEWARRAVGLLDELEADRIVAESNQGGAMVEATIRSVRRAVPVKLVHASRGKVTRAEPISALWEQKKAHLVGVHAELEDELCGFAPGPMEKSPDRADAMVWAATELSGTGVVSWDGIPEDCRPRFPRPRL